MIVGIMHDDSPSIPHFDEAKARQRTDLCRTRPKASITHSLNIQSTWKSLTLNSIG